MRHKKLVVIFLLLSFTGSMIMAQDTGPSYEPSLQELIINNDLHKIAGFISLGLMASTGISGALGWEGHPILGYTTLGFSALSSTMGFIAYSESLEVVWPHVMFNGLGIVGLFLNAFVFTPGSTEHKISGIAAASSFSLGLVSIIIVTN